MHNQAPVTLAPVTLAPVTAARSQTRVVALLHLITLGLAGLQLYVRTLPATATAIPTPQDAEAAWWGLWPMTYLPQWIVVIAWSTLLLYLMVWWLTALGWLQPPQWVRLPALPWLYLIAVLLVIGFYLFPIQHTRWGDAYILSTALALDDPALRLTHSWQAPLDVFLHSQVWQWWHAPFGWADATGVYRLLSPLAGMLYLGAALTVARRLQPTPRWLTFGLLTSLGVIQLFFGYIENYSFAAAGILLYLGWGIAALHDEQPLWSAATALAITNALHPSTIILLPSLLYVGWVLAQKRNKSARFVVLYIGLPLTLVALATIGLMETGNHGIAALLSTDRPGGGDARFFVPVWTTTTRWEQYIMFSWLHLRDLINQQLLVAPVVLPALLIIGPWLFSPNQIEEQPPRKVDATVRFLAIATLSHWLLIWTWNPDYGGQRDWDLFSLAAIPAALLLAVALPRRLSHPRYLQGGAIGLLMLQCLQTVAWIYQNTLPWNWP